MLETHVPTSTLGEYVSSHVLFKNRLIDCFKQKWRAEVTDSSILYYYKHIKTTFGYERYLDKIVNPKLRSVLTK